MKPNAMIELNNILMATDFTMFSKQGCQLARDLCRRFNAKLHLLHVIDDRAPSLPDAAARLIEANDRAVARQVAEEEEAMVKLWGQFFPDYRKDHEVEFAALSGHPVVQILEYAHKHSIDLIVAGTHGRTGIEHFLSGSVAEELVRMARCPVLTVRGTPQPRPLDVTVDVRITNGKMKTNAPESTP